MSGQSQSPGRGNPRRSPSDSRCARSLRLAARQSSAATRIAACRSMLSAGNGRPSRSEKHCSFLQITKEDAPIIGGNGALNGEHPHKGRARHVLRDRRSDSAATPSTSSCSTHFLVHLTIIPMFDEERERGRPRKTAARHCIRSARLRMRRCKFSSFDFNNAAIDHQRGTNQGRWSDDCMLWIQTRKRRQRKENAPSMAHSMRNKLVGILGYK